MQDHIEGGSWNMDPVIASVADRLNEAVRIEQTRNLLTWTACLTVGDAFEEIPTQFHGQALKELAGRTRRTTRTLNNYLRVYGAVTGMDLPNEAMEVLQYSVVLAVLTEYGDERGRQLIEEIHDGDLSLMQARVQETMERIKAAKAERKCLTFKQALVEAIGDLGKRIPSDGPFNEVEREQLHRIMDTLMDEWNEQGKEATA